MEVLEPAKPTPTYKIGNEKLCKITSKASEKLTSLLTRQGPAERCAAHCGHRRWLLRPAI